MANRGSAKQVVVWIVVALSILGTVAYQLYDDGASDIGFILAMSVATVIAVAIVAPRRFASIRGASPDWEDNIEYRAKSQSGEVSPQETPVASIAPNQGSRSDAA